MLYPTSLATATLTVVVYVVAAYSVIEFAVNVYAGGVVDPDVPEGATLAVDELLVLLVHAVTAYPSFGVILGGDTVHVVDEVVILQVCDVLPIAFTLLPFVNVAVNEYTVYSFVYVDVDVAAAATVEYSAVVSCPVDRPAHTALPGPTAVE